MDETDIWNNITALCDTHNVEHDPDFCGHHFSQDFEFICGSYSGHPRCSLEYLKTIRVKCDDNDIFPNYEDAYFSIKDYTRIINNDTTNPENNIDKIKTALLTSPVIALIEVYDNWFGDGTDGDDVYYFINGDHTLSHALLIIGYNDDTKHPHWICRNSSEPPGYIRVAYNTTCIDSWACYKVEINEESSAKFVPSVMTLENALTYNFHEIDSIIDEKIWIIDDFTLNENTDLVYPTGFSNDFKDEYPIITLNDYYLKYDENSDGSADFIPEDVEWNSSTSSMVGYFPNLVSALDESSNEDEIYIENNTTIDQAASIPDSMTLKIEENKRITVEDSLSIGSNVTFTHQAENKYWDGLYVSSGGTLNVNGSMTVEYAERGLDIRSSNVTFSTSKSFIRNCLDYGVYIYNCSPTIKNVEFFENAEGVNYASIFITDTSSSPILEHLTIKDSYYGIRIDVCGDAILRQSEINEDNSINSHLIDVHSYAGLYMYEGYNNLLNCNATKKAIYNGPNSYGINAVLNYWGGYTPVDSLFFNYANVTYSPVADENQSAGVPAKMVPHADNPLFEEALKLELSGDYSQAYDLYKKVIAESKEQEIKKMSIKALLRLNDRYTHNYKELAGIIEEVLSSAKPAYRAMYDYILCDIHTREGNYENALIAFEEMVETYKGTPMEVEMLVRLSTINSMFLKNIEKAEEYADHAAAINPGQASLLAAYSSINKKYDPNQHVDKFKDAIEEFSQPQIPKPIPEEITEFVVANPNPFNPITTITYSIKEQSPVRLEIYNINGQRITTLVNGTMSAGAHKAVFDGSHFGSGIYFYKFESKGFRKNGKMLMVK